LLYRVPLDQEKRLSETTHYFLSAAFKTKPAATTLTNTTRTISKPNSLTPNFTEVKLTQLPAESVRPVVPRPDESKAKNAATEPTIPTPTIFRDLSMVSQYEESYVCAYDFLRQQRKLAIAT
jgi:hypothetical protein